MALLKIINFILLNISLVGSSFFIFRLINKKGAQRFSWILLSVITLYFSLITLIMVGLGILGMITFLNATIVSYTIFGLLFFITRKKIALLKQLGGLLSIKNKSKSNFILGIALFTPAGILLFIKFFSALLQIPLEFDALVYHLPIVTEWLQTGSLMDVYYTAFAGPLAYYPSNFDLFYLWTILPLHSDFLVNLINFPLFILLAVAIYYTSMNFGISKKISLFASAFPLYMPVFLQQAGTIFVDIYFVLIFVLSIYFLQTVAKDTTKKSNSILFGLALGLFVGTKYIGLPYCILLLVVFLAIHLLKKGKSYSPLALGLFSSLLTGSFFYIRNWLNSGNPLFPAEINLFGNILFQGYPNASAKLGGSSLFEHINEIPVIKELASAFWIMAGLPGLLILLSFIISLFFILYSASKKNLKKHELAIATLFLLSGAGYFLLYIKAPYSYRDLIHNVRYAMPFLVLGIFNLGFLATKIQKIRPFFYIFSVFAFIHSLIYIITSPAYKIRFDIWALSEYRNYLAMLFIAVLALLFGIFFRHKRIFAATAIILSAMIFSYVTYFSYSEREILASRFYNSWYPEDNKYFGVWKSALWLDQNAPDAKIAYSGFHFHYPLFGRQLSRKIDYVNINECVDCRYVDYKNSLDSIRRDPNYDSWVANLETKKKDYIVIDPTITPEARSYEFEWIIQHSEKFELAQQYKNTYIYKIK